MFRKEGAGATYTQKLLSFKYGCGCKKMGKGIKKTW